MILKVSAVRKPMPWMSSASRYGFSRTSRAASWPHASRTRRASALPSPMSEPRVDVGDRCDLDEPLANAASAARGDALDDAQILWTVS
jgi:hypothetical protein